MYLVKALVATRFPTTTDYDSEVAWAVNQYRIVDDSVIVQIRRHPDVFSEIAGPDEVAVFQALVDLTTITAAYAATSATVNALASLHLYGEGAPVDYTDGDPEATGEGTAPPGALYSVISGTGAGDVYRNSGTQAQPTWTKLADAA
jgi:hypothetical protein